MARFYAKRRAYGAVLGPIDRQAGLVVGTIVVLLAGVLFGLFAAMLVLR